MDGKTIRQLRESWDITQVELAARLGYTQQYVSKVERLDESGRRVSELTRRIFLKAIADLAYERMPAA